MKRGGGGGQSNTGEWATRMSPASKRHEGIALFVGKRA